MLHGLARWASALTTAAAVVASTLLIEPEAEAFQDAPPAGGQTPPELLPPPAVGWGPAKSVRVAWNDARLLEKHVAQYTRYLDLSVIPPEDRVGAAVALAGHPNLLSDRTVSKQPVLVGKVLLRINLAEYASKRRLKAFVATYERLGEVDPYYHVQARETKWWPGGVWPKDGVWYPGPGHRKSFKYVHRHVYPAPELTEAANGKRVYDELTDVTQSAVPLLPADWFLNRTAAQVERDGTGYYDFLGVRTLADLERLAGVPKRSLRKEQLETVGKSAVAQPGVLRGIERKAAEDSGQWATYDFRLFKALLEAKDVVDPRRVPRSVEKFAEAIEWIGALPNGGIINAAVNAKDGKLQATVPDFIAIHRGAPDTRIHPNVGCLKCHGVHDGLMPIAEWYRNLSRPPLELRVADFEERIRYDEQFARRLVPLLDKDRKGFNDWALEAAGVPFAEFSAAYGAEFDRYEQADVTAAWAARHLGVTQEEYQAALDRGIRQGKLDLLLSAHRLSDKDRARSFDIRTWEVLYPIARAALRGEYPQADRHRLLRIGASRR